MEASTSGAGVVSAREGSVDDTKLVVYLKDALTLLLENKPQRPLAFLANYFRMITQGRDPVQRAYRYLRMSPVDRTTFMDNLVSAYNMLESDPPTAGGLTGDKYMSLLQLLVADFPSDIVRTLFRVLGKGEQEIVSFQDFLGGVKVCLLFEEFLEEAEDLFERHSFVIETGERVMLQSNLDKLIAAFAFQTAEDDPHRPTSREEFVALCRKASRERLQPGPNGHVTFLQFAASLFRVATPPESYTPI